MQVCFFLSTFHLGNCSVAIGYVTIVCFAFLHIIKRCRVLGWTSITLCDICTFWAKPFLCLTCMYCYVLSSEKLKKHVMFVTSWVINNKIDNHWCEFGTIKLSTLTIWNRKYIHREPDGPKLTHRAGRWSNAIKTNDVVRHHLFRSHSHLPSLAAQSSHSLLSPLGTHAAGDVDEQLEDVILSHLDKRLEGDGILSEADEV